MTQKNRLMSSFIVSLFIFAAAILIWSYQNGKLFIFGSEQNHAVIYNYNTNEKWQNGEFQNTAYNKNIGYLTAKFVYDPSWKPPFDTTSDKQILSIEKSINPAINEFTMFYNNGIVIKQNVIGNQPIIEKTCYNAEEMSTLFSLIDASKLLRETNITNNCTNCQKFTVSEVLKDNNSEIVWKKFIPVNYAPIFSSLFYWPDSKSTSTPNACSQNFSSSAQAKDFKTLPEQCVSNNECEQNSDAYCTADYQPVCAENNITYGNTCEASKSCQKISCNGECPCKTNESIDACFPTTGWGGYVDRGYYISSNIGSDKVNSFKKLIINKNNIFVPSDNSYIIQFQFAGSKDNFKSWSDVISLGDISNGIDLDLTGIGLLKESKYLKVKIIYKTENSVPGNINPLAKASNTLSPLISSFDITANEIGLDTVRPSGPTNIKNVLIDNNSVKIYWDPPTDESGIKKYHIINTGSNNITFGQNTAQAAEVSETGSTSSSNFTISGIEPNKNYNLTIQAEDGNGNMSLKTSDSFIIKNGKLATFANNSSSNQTSGILSKIIHLASTGANLWVNLLIAFILSIIVIVATNHKRADY